MQKAIRRIPDRKASQNDGQLDMYLVEDAHEAIIDRETFNQVQKMKGKLSGG